MRIYFLSNKPAALKLDGIYLGIIDKFERHIEVLGQFNILAEIVPDGNLQPLNFFIDENFFKNPPPFADVYLIEGDALIYFKNYEPKGKINVIVQINFCGSLYTLFYQSGAYLSRDGEVNFCTELEGDFSRGEFILQEVNNIPLLILKGNKKIIIISQSGQIIFNDGAQSFCVNEKISVTQNFSTCAKIKATSVYGYDGERLHKESCVINEGCTPQDEILHFAFFESVLYGCDFKNYLCDELKNAATSLKNFLGNFTGVTVPTEKFYLSHGNMRAAGLIYPLRKNLFKVTYYCADVTDGKVTNIYKLDGD